MTDFGEVLGRRHSAYGSAFVQLMAGNGGLHVSSRTGAKYRIPTHFGFCYGVEKSIDMAFETVNRYEGRRIYLTHDVIHNPMVNQDLRERKVIVLPRGPGGRLNLDGVHPGDVVIIAAFGCRFQDVEALKAKGCVVVDTTCGAIVRVWKRVEEYAAKGITAVIHGVWDHEEVRATVSQAAKLGGHFLIVRDMAEARRVGDFLRAKMGAEEFLDFFKGKVSENFDPRQSLGKIGIASQTTMFRSETLEIQKYLVFLYKDVFDPAAGGNGVLKKYDTICAATQERQDALERLLRQDLDLVMIIGGFKSSNTTHLSKIAGERCPAFHIQGPEDILSFSGIRCMNPSTRRIGEKRGWLPSRTPVIGIGTGASTPDVLIERVIERIEECLNDDKNKSVN